MPEVIEKTTPGPKTNHIGLTREAYKGGKSTLCPGCGHDAISNHIISACFESGVNPLMLGKFSGIGCSSKTPAYFVSQAHAFNAAHGRMPSVSTGALLANSHLIGLAVSGDGDTASIGLGQFCHLIRRNVPLVYIIENNGVYGLTKGQFSATADPGSKQKKGTSNLYDAIDLCSLAIDLGCGFVARSFSGDKKQLVPLIQAAFAHNGTAVIDVISPCVTFNNHPGSTKSYDSVKEHDIPLHELGFIPPYEQITADYEEGTIKEVVLHDGSHLMLKKLDQDYDPTNRFQALQVLEESRQHQHFTTGLLYYNPDKKTFSETIALTETPLYTLKETDLRPSQTDFETIMDSFR